MKCITYISLLFISLLLLFSCSKDGDATLKIHLTDASISSYEAVYLDIQSVEISQSSEYSQNGWSALSMVQTGAYNLLQYSNGKDTLLATLNLPARNIRMVRLVLGPDNRVVVEGKDRTLSVPQSEDRNLVAPVEVSLISGKSSEVWIDVDVARSLIQKPNGQFLFQPVIRAFTKENTGQISGDIEPAEFFKSLILTDNQDTLGTQSGSDGHFLFLGVNPGSWSLIGIPEEGVTQVLVDSIQVTKAARIQLGTINPNSETE